MGLLSGNFNKEVTKEWLKENKFFDSYWGRPLNITYRNGIRVVDWHPHQKCWDFIENTEYYYVGHLIYFPDNFKGFINTKDGSQNPAGYVYIQMENDDLDWYERIKVESVADIEAAFAVMQMKSEELNKNTWSYNWNYLKK